MNELDLFAAAIEISDREEREALLDRECAGRDDLRERLELLLGAHRRSHALLDQLEGGDPNATAAMPAECELVGTVIAGRYKLLEQIGDGGMGTVWMAEQREPVKRLVAVKLIKAGMDSKGVLGRFEAERQALAMMDHPNIAKVLDAGTDDDGRPYFVMELVKGLPLTEYCDSRRMSVKDRLELFVQICSAVQHAHQKAIIHRDLKPSNILITEHDGKPVPKVIDFGLAKALGTTSVLTERTLHTAYGTVVGTPLYMAPEQVGINALDVDTRTDIYALGVILYELLTGSTPLEKARFKETAWEEVKRLIREEEPQRPSLRLSSDKTLASLAASRQAEASQLPRLIRGDLDWIVMRALDKDRSRRYETANGLSRDVQRYLSGDAVEACPPTLGYRLGKAYRKHRAAVLTTVSFAIVLLVATGVSITFWWLAKQNERAAIKSAEKERLATQLAKKNEQTAIANAQKAEAAQRAHRKSSYTTSMSSLSAIWESQSYANSSFMNPLSMWIPKPGDEDLRGFEWRYWNRLVNTGHRSVKLANSMRSARQEPPPAFSKDGRRVAFLYSTDRTDKGRKLWLEVWDTVTEKEILPPICLIENFPNGAFGAAAVFSEDGTRVSVEWDPVPWTSRKDDSVDWDNHDQSIFLVLDLATKQPLCRIHGQNRVAQNGWSFSPDGRRVVMAFSEVGPDYEISRKTLRIYDIADEKQRIVTEAEKDAEIYAQFSPDGKQLAVTVERNESPSRLAILDGFSGEERQSWPIEHGRVSAPVYSPEGTLLAAVVSTANDRVRTWEGVVRDAASGEIVQTLPLAPSLPDEGYASYTVQFSPDGARLAISTKHDQKSPRNVTVWETASGKKLFAFTHAGAHSVFSLDSQLIASDDSVIEVRDATTGNIKVTLPHQFAIQYSSQAQIAAMSFGTGRELYLFPKYSDFYVGWNCNEQKPFATIPNANLGKRYSGSPMDIHPNGRLVAWYEDGEEHAVVKIRDLTTGNEVQLPMEPDASSYRKLDFVAGGRYLLCKRGMRRDPSQDATIWNVETGEIVYGHQWKASNFPASIAVAPDGQRIALTNPVGDAASVRTRLVILALATGNELWDCEWDDLTGMQPIFSPDSHRVLAETYGHLEPERGYTKRERRVWNAESGEEINRAPYDVRSLRDAKSWSEARTFFAMSLGIDPQNWDAKVDSDSLPWAAPWQYVNPYLCELSPDKSRLVGYEWNASTLKMLEMDYGQLVFSLPIENKKAPRFRFSKDGNRLFVLTTDGDGIKVQTLDATPLPKPEQP